MPLPTVVLPQAARVGRRFGAAAADYDREALAQQQSARRLLHGVDFRGCVLDIGCGTGQMSAAIAGREGVSLVLALDIAHGMLLSPALRHSGVLRLQADAACLPVATRTVDQVVSNFALQWLPDPAAFAAELARVLRPGGTFHLAMPAEGSLRELREAWMRVEPEPPLNTFRPVSGWRQALDNAGLTVLRAEVTPVFQYYPTARALLRGLKTIGASETVARRGGLWGRGRLEALEAAMESYRGPEGLPLRYDVLHLTGYLP